MGAIRDDKTAWFRPPPRSASYLNRLSRRRSSAEGPQERQNSDCPYRQTDQTLLKSVSLGHERRRPSGIPERQVQPGPNELTSGKREHPGQQSLANSEPKDASPLCDSHPDDQADGCTNQRAQRNIANGLGGQFVRLKPTDQARQDARYKCCDKQHRSGHLPHHQRSGLATNPADCSSTSATWKTVASSRALPMT